MIKHRQLARILAPILATVIGTLFLLGLLSGLALASPGDLFVTVSGGGDCSQPAPCDLQTALGQAVDGDAVYVAQGTYTSTGVAVIIVTNSVTLYGGWDGTTTVPPVRNPQVNPTTLDGEGLRQVVYITGTITPTLEGLWLTNGSASGRGGGVAVHGAHPVISGCWILSNTGKDGGGIYLAGSTNALLVNNEIYSNTADQYGGGIASDTSLSITLTGNKFYGNTAHEDGGAISLWYGDQANLLSNEIYSNTADRNGGGIYIRDGSTVLNNNVISHSAALGHGGAIYIDGTRATLVDNRVFDNTSGAGGGIYFSNCITATLDGNRVVGNVAGSEAGIGLEGSTATLVNNIIADNIKLGFPCASGIGIGDSTITLTHNTIARNRGPVPGSGIYVAAPSPQASVVTLINNIIVSHSVGITVAAGSTATLEATLWGDGIWANETNWDGSGAISTGTINIWQSPGFVNSDSGDYHIVPSSAAVDQGIDTEIMVDIDGDRRPIGTQPDIGADEAWQRVLLPLVLRNYS
jgi:hypothetical protein